MKGEKARRYRLHKAVALTSVIAVIAAVTLAAHGSVRYPGDVNTDKVIDVSDAVLLSRYIGEDPYAKMSRAGAENADANGDSNVDLDDVILILKQIARFAPMPRNPYLDPPEETETTAIATDTTETETTTVTITTETQPESTSVQVSETTQPRPQDSVLIADAKQYPLGVSISVLTGQTQPDEMLTVSYDIGNIIFATFAQNPAETVIAVAYQDNIVGYYIFCSDYSAPEGYSVAEYRDKEGLSAEERNTPGMGRLYAVLVMQNGVSIEFPHLTDINDMAVLSKLNYYALNGVRAASGVNTLIWDEEASKLAVQHSRDMADKNYFDHDSVTDSGLLIYYEIDADKNPLNQLFAKAETAADGSVIHYMTDEAGNAITGADGNRIILKNGDQVTAGYSPCNVSVRMGLFGIDWCKCAENIDYGYVDPFSALDGWYNSLLGHRLNVLSEKYTRVGIGFAYNGSSDGKYYGTQDYYRGWDD